MNPGQAYDDGADRPLLAELSLDEKVSLLSGKEFWSLPAIPAIGLEAIVTSKLSSIPVGGAIEFFALFPYKPSTRDPSRVVVTDGAAISLVFALYSPALASMGELASTPPKTVTPAVAPTADEKRHVYDEGSKAPLTL